MIEGPHSRVEIEVGANSVKKIYTDFWGYGCPYRELYWLEMLSISGFTPHLRAADPECIEMFYCGLPVAWRGLPSGWRDQAEAMVAWLEAQGCCHNDIRPENILVKDDRLYLIDFGWATHADEPIPEIWPESIGSSYRKGVHDFDDEYSLFKSLEAIRDGKA